MALIKPMVITCLLLFFGCQSSSSPRQKTTEFNYQPQGQQEFVFAPLPKNQQKQGYFDVCFVVPQYRISCSLNKLPYRKYLGKRGYYTSRAPIPYVYGVYEQRVGDFAYEAVLETGERIYVLKSQSNPMMGKYIIPYPSQ